MWLSTSDYKQKFENYKNALSRLNDGIMKFDQTNDLLCDGLIQRFEFAFELAWKALKASFEEEGLFVMEKKHLRRLRESFSDILPHKKAVCLNIPDEYQFMDREFN